MLDLRIDADMGLPSFDYPGRIVRVSQGEDIGFAAGEEEVGLFMGMRPEPDRECRAGAAPRDQGRALMQTGGLRADGLMRMAWHHSHDRGR